MDKNIREYEIFIKQEIKKIEQDLDSSNNDKIKQTHEKIERLDNLHQQTIRNFQHERLIHLLVTFFFASLLILSIMTIFISASLPIAYNYTVLSTLILIICAFLFITEVFYVRYYYQLENGIQSLYKFSKIIYYLTNRK